MSFSGSTTVLTPKNPRSKSLKASEVALVVLTTDRCPCTSFTNKSERFPSLFHKEFHTEKLYAGRFWVGDKMAGGFCGGEHLGRFWQRDFYYKPSSRTFGVFATTLNLQALTLTIFSQFTDTLPVF